MERCPPIVVDQFDQLVLFRNHLFMHEEYAGDFFRSRLHRHVEHGLALFVLHERIRPSIEQDLEQLSLLKFRSDVQRGLHVKVRVVDVL